MWLEVDSTKTWDEKTVKDKFSSSYIWYIPPWKIQHRNIYIKCGYKSESSGFLGWGREVAAGSCKNHVLFEVFHVLDHPEQARVALSRPLYEMCVVALVGELASNMLMVAGWGLPSSAHWPCPVPTRILRVGWFAFPACLLVSTASWGWLIMILGGHLGLRYAYKSNEISGHCTSSPKFFMSFWDRGPSTK